MNEETTKILDGVMRKVESWRISLISSICKNHQIIGFHIGALVEELFRVYTLTGFISSQTPEKLHSLYRQDIFAIEWILRSLQLPSDSYTEIKELRNSWNHNIADQCTEALKAIRHYSDIRDLVICTKNDGYIIEMPNEHTIVFKDTTDWQGIRDFKSRLISEKISNCRNKDNPAKFIKSKTLKATSLNKDFPNDLQINEYSSNDFWCLWEWLFNLSLNTVKENLNIHNHGKYASTTDTKELTILMTKKKLIERLQDETELSESAINYFINWLIFNSHTPKKFSLFHRPLIELNTKFIMIIPHTILMTHIPTAFFRLLSYHDKSAFDSSSSEIEKKTLTRIKSHLNGQNRILKTNLKFDYPINTEIDFVEYDESESRISVCQAKLTVRADSVFEVDHSNDVLKKGVEQLKKNKIFFNDIINIKELFLKLEKSYRENTRIDYFLLPTNFTGSDFLQIPDWIKVIPVEFCLLPTYKGCSMHSIWNAYKNLWDSLDNQINSCHSSQVKFEIAGFKVYYPGLRIN